MAKKTNKNSKELSGPVKVKHVMPGKCVGIMRRRTMIKWLRTMLPSECEAKQRRVRFFDLQMLGYQRSGEEIMFLNWRVNISKMRFFGIGVIE